MWKEGQFVSDDGKGNPLTTESHFMTATGIIEYTICLFWKGSKMYE